MIMAQIGAILMAVGSILMSLAEISNAVSDR